MKKAKTISTFEDAYQTYYRSIFLFIRSHVENAETAQDITQNVFVAAYRNWAKLNDALGGEKAWLYCIARNKLKNYYRDKKDQVSLEALGENGTQESEQEDFPAQATHLMEQRTALAQALSELPQRTRDIVLLRYFSGKSSKEIAALLQISEGNVRVILTRGLQKLGDCLKQNGYTLEE